MSITTIRKELFALHAELNPHWNGRLHMERRELTDGRSETVVMRTLRRIWWSAVREATYSEYLEAGAEQTVIAAYGDETGDPYVAIQNCATDCLADMGATNTRSELIDRLRHTVETRAQEEEDTGPPAYFRLRGGNRFPALDSPLFRSRPPASTLWSLVAKLNCLVAIYPGGKVGPLGHYPIYGPFVDSPHFEAWLMSESRLSVERS